MVAYLQAYLLSILPIDAVTMDTPATETALLSLWRCAYSWGLPVRGTVSDDGVQPVKCARVCVYSERVLAVEEHQKHTHGTVHLSAVELALESL